ncbi:MAG: hypothetical protein ABWZ80_07860 [Beijerinckiaceae bacterium]
MKSRAAAGLFIAIFGVSLVLPAAAQSSLASCKGDNLQSYIGKPFAELRRVRPDGRYVCSTCAMTMDFRADRLTVTYDVKTMRVTELRCV